MSAIVISTRSRPLRVWFHQLSRETLSSTSPDLILPSRSLRSPGFQPFGIATVALQNCTTPSYRRALGLPSEICEPFNTHRSAVVQRFSPIHF
jgi:hypothetical protein